MLKLRGLAWAFGSATVTLSLVSSLFRCLSICLSVRFADGDKEERWTRVYARTSSTGEEARAEPVPHSRTRTPSHNTTTIEKK